MNENDILRQAVEALQASVASLSESHRKEVDALQSKIKEQEAQIAWLKQQLFGSKSEKRPVFDPNCPDLFAAEFADLFSQAGKERDEAVEQLPGEDKPSPKRKRQVRRMIEAHHGGHEGLDGERGHQVQRKLRDWEGHHLCLYQVGQHDALSGRRQDHA